MDNTNKKTQRTDKELKLSESFIEPYKTKTPPFGFNGLGAVVYTRTYSRVKADGTQEQWWETVRRCVEGAQAIGAGYTESEMETLYDKVFNLKCNFAGRMLWQLGTDSVKRFQASSLLNCWYTSMNELEDFCFVFENLMLGGGVGFGLRREDIHELPKVKRDVSVTALNSKDADFIVPDSREGWVSLLRKVLEAFFLTGKSFSYSTVLVRGAGEKIAGFGGTASGPGILVEGMTKLIQVLKTREGKKLRSVDVLDINNILGSIVVSGNVRRSAQIAIGESDDVNYLKAKRWDLGNIPNWRAMSNNSLFVDNFEDILPQFWEGYTGNGEPYGLINMPLSQKYGRLADGPMKDCSMYPTREDNCSGFNPCAEISLADGECCNLAELYLNRIDSKEELIECAKLLYKTQKAVWGLDFLYDKTKKVVYKNRRIGLGVTGVCQSLNKLDWLSAAYTELRAYDREWSKKLGVPESIKLTTVKPSGSLSLLAGATPGVHPAYSRYYIRRVRVASGDALVSRCREAQLPVEYVRNFDGTEDRNTVVVEFPCEAGESTVIASDMSAVDQLELVKRLQTLWADNSVSVTVYYRKEELAEVQGWLKTNYSSSLKSVSFLLHSEHGFDQAPYEEITKSQYQERLSTIDLGKLEATGTQTLDGLECESGVCPIK